MPSHALECFGDAFEAKRPLRQRAATRSGEPRLLSRSATSPVNHKASSLPQSQRDVKAAWTSCPTDVQRPCAQADDPYHLVTFNQIDPKRNSIELNSTQLNSVQLKMFLLKISFKSLGFSEEGLKSMASSKAP